MSKLLFEDENNGATFSECRKYRYELHRIWDESLPLVMFIGLNPSTANETQSDNTITKVRKIAKHNGFGGFYMMNCFPYVSTNPNDLVVNDDNRVNDGYLTAIGDMCKDVVFAWGNFKIVFDKKRNETLYKMFPNAKALTINKNGSPKHPLYCKDETILIPYKP